MYLWQAHDSQYLCLASRGSNAHESKSAGIAVTAAVDFVGTKISCADERLGEDNLGSPMKKPKSVPTVPCRHRMIFYPSLAASPSRHKI